jgi:hypothetical protein
MEALVGKDAVDETVRRVNYMLRYGRLLTTVEMRGRVWAKEQVDA